MDGLALLELIKRKQPELTVVMMTAYGSIPMAVEAIKLGAMDIIEKPADLRLLTQKIEEAKNLKLKRPR